MELESSSLRLDNETRGCLKAGSLLSKLNENTIYRRIKLLAHIPVFVQQLGQSSDCQISSLFTKWGIQKTWVLVSPFSQVF
jgi:hypothetical protein